ncbi:MAG: site-2 protease family protein [Dehalococcoidia bacterium]
MACFLITTTGGALLPIGQSGLLPPSSCSLRVLIHELAHAIVAIRRGLPVPRITLFIFGGVSQLARQPETARAEFVIAAAGPATSLVIAALSGVLAITVGTANEKVEGVFGYLAAVNVLLGIFNLLPGFPLDGGRVLRSIVWGRTHSFRRATNVAAGVGQIFAYGLMGLAFLFILNGFIWNGIWFAFIGWFLLGAAKGESSQLQLDTILRPLRAKNVMHQDFISVPPGIPVQEVVDRYIVEQGERAVMVANGDAVLGILTVTDVQRVPRADWPNTPAQRIMTPRDKVVTVSTETPALDVLQVIGERRLNQVPVLADGRMVGLITRRELMDRVHLAGSLAPNEPPADEVGEGRTG